MEIKPVKVKKRANKNSIQNSVNSSKIICSGRRKTSVANIQFLPISNTKSNVNESIIVNTLLFKEYFPEESNYLKILEPLKLTEQLNKVKIIAKLVGGGKTGQAEALRHAISRALVMYDEKFRSILKVHNYLTRDSRIKERKKPGLKKARKAPQFAKR